MAEAFGFSPEAVRTTSGELQVVIDEVQTFSARGDSYAGSIASGLIMRAIHGFEENSSDHRKALVEAVTGVKRLLDGLLQGAEAVDSELRQGLEQFGSTSQGGGEGAGPSAGQGGRGEMV